MILTARTQCNRSHARIAHLGSREVGRFSRLGRMRPTQREGRLTREGESRGSAMRVLKDVSLLLIPLVLTGVFVMLFGMAWLEPKPKHAPTHRAAARRTGKPA